MIEATALTSTTPLPWASRVGIAVCLLLIVASLCLWAIPFWAADVFGVHGVWDEPSDYLLASLLAGTLGALAPSWLIAPATKRLKYARRVIVVVSIIAVVLAACTLVWLGVHAIGMGL